MVSGILQVLSLGKEKMRKSKDDRRHTLRWWYPCCHIIITIITLSIQGKPVRHCASLPGNQAISITETTIKSTKVENLGYMYEHRNDIYWQNTSYSSKQKMVDFHSMAVRLSSNDLLKPSVLGNVMNRAAGSELLKVLSASKRLWIKEVTMPFTASNVCQVC